MHNLVIVESPTKARTLARFLGKGFEVKSSKGHVCDLPKSELGVDLDRDFAPKYVIALGKEGAIRDLRKALKKADKVWLATDLDREGEAIASHLFEVLGLKSKTEGAVRRVVFHEITEDAVREAFAHPRGIDLDLVSAQKARRVLDRLVGYKLSPLLWKKVRYGLSAGRVQSVAVRFVVEREKERERFSSDSYWTLTALFESREGVCFEAELRKIDGKRIERVQTERLFSGTYRVKKTILDSRSAVEKVESKLWEEKPSVAGVEVKDVSRNPYPPLMTVSLQSSAAGLGFSSSQVMRLAQRLYEEGYITYHRTDSRFLAESALENCRAFIKNNLGEQYLPEGATHYQTKSKLAQEAHEAIRPTDFRVRPGSLRKIGKDAAKLYELIWRQTLACQMKPAVFSRVTVDIAAGKFLFRGVGQTLKFDGWLKVQPRVRERYKESHLPSLENGEVLSVSKLEAGEHRTTPPPRYSEAALIRALKKYEIGRPSTYAAIISTIQKRGYVKKEGGYFRPTDVGVVVIELLAEHFPNIVDVSFTAQMEEDLDEIARGGKGWVPVVREFWEPFANLLAKKSKELKREDFTVLEKTDEICPECGKPLVVKLGKYGKFFSCSGFPKCKYAKPFSDVDLDGRPDEVDQSQLEGRCPECGGVLKLKEGRFGKFIACANYPKCKFTKNYLDKIGVRCPECGRGEVIVKRTRRAKVFYGCSRYPECKFASWKHPKGKGTKQGLSS